MKLVGAGYYWDDLRVGDRFKTLGRTITEADIVNFIACTGMLESLFIDAEFRASHSAIQGRAAPAALVYSFAEGLVLNAMAQNTGLAFLQADMNVLQPTLANDTIHVELEVIEVRPAAKDGRGLVRTLNNIINQRGEKVMELRPLRLMSGRPAATG